VGKRQPALQDAILLVGKVVEVAVVVVVVVAVVDVVVGKLCRGLSS
jgi:hypothetical protein